MPLSLLPPLNLSSAREFVKFEVTCAGRPAPARPALPSYDSFASSATSSSTDTSTSTRKSRPSLSPEALLIHAFGPSALSRLAPSTSTSSVRSKQQQPNSSQTPSASASSAASVSRSRTSSISSKRGRKGVHDVHPAPPPRGTFRSVAKPTRTSPPLEGKLPLTELIPFRSPRDDSPAEVRRYAASCECERNSERELPISPEYWREKVEERLERRKLLRPKFRVRNAVKTPLDIDHRPLEGSIRIPPRPEFAKQQNPGLSKRNHSSPSLSKLVGDEENRPPVRDGEQIRSGDDFSLRRKSMVEMQDIGDLIKQCDLMNLKDGPR